MGVRSGEPPTPRAGHGPGDGDNPRLRATGAPRIGRCQTWWMGKVNRSRVGGGDDDYGEVGAEPTIPAKYAGACSACGQRFAAGDPIAPVVVEKRVTYQHRSCRYPASALLERAVTHAETEAGVAALDALQVSMCRATTNKGKPCGNAPQKGEELCGPHLAQLVTRTARAAGPSSL